ncbi:MAG: SDR family oxidoreductase [Elusimicrobia bacterium]|nr:SDR family oxidoreductase [Elusimicrobiota bacterium]
MKDKICLVTGATSGIGYEAALDLARRGATVVLTARDKARGEAAREAILQATGAKAELLTCDLADLASVRAAAAEFKTRHDRLHVLLNNAGVWHRARRVTKDGLEETFQANHLGPFLLTTLLLDVLKASAPARIVNVSSALHYRGRLNWDDLQMEKRFDGTKAYSDSKLANVLFTRALAGRLTGTGVTVNAVHPGVIATSLSRDMPAFIRALLPFVLSTPAKGAQPLVRLAAGADVEGVTGRYFDKLKEKKAAAFALDDTAAARLWKVSVELASADKS